MRALGGYLLAGALLSVALGGLYCLKVHGQAKHRGGATTPSSLAAPPAVQGGTGPKEPIGTASNGIFLSYPKSGSEIPSPSTYLAGAVPPGSTLTANGKPVKVNRQGFFAHVVPLAFGSNAIDLVRNGNPALSFHLTLIRPAPPHPVPAEPAQILASSVQPTQDIGVQPGDIIEFGMRASPGGTGTVRLGQRVIGLQAPGSKGAATNIGLATEFGVTYQRTPATAKDLYTGFYRVSAGDCWQNETPVFSLVKNGASVSQPASGKISVLAQPFVSSTVHDDTIVRVGPGAGRTTPLPEGVRVLIDGYVGDSWRCAVAPGKHLWIERKDLTGDEGPGSAPQAPVRTINIESDGKGGALVTVPLNQRLPFEIKQEINPVNRLQLRIYGATADTDWITEPSTSSRATDEATRSGKAFPNPQERGSNPVTYITWQQQEDGLYQMTVNLNLKQQWGFDGEYRGTNLVLRVQGPPPVVPGSASLRGLRICVDPGHGGPETGAIGCSGIKEATINLAIAKRLQHILSAQGADVIMTRDADVEVSLNDRVEIAKRNHCHLLVSVHNNSLPDGRNPWVEHGTSSYYYHPQALLYASCLRRGVVKDLQFVDFHTRWQNLALCRPSRMPAALVEVGFMINPDEYATLLTAGGQQRAALGIAQGVHEFLNEALLGKTGNAGSGRSSKRRR